MPAAHFSPIDQIRALDDCVLGDYNFVDKDVCISDPVRYARLLPHSGPRWCWRATCQYMLDRGIVKWTDVK